MPIHVENYVFVNKTVINTPGTVDVVSYDRADCRGVNDNVTPGNLAGSGRRWRLTHYLRYTCWVNLVHCYSVSGYYLPIHEVNYLFVNNTVVINTPGTVDVFLMIELVAVEEKTRVFSNLHKYMVLTGISVSMFSSGGARWD